MEKRPGVAVVVIEHSYKYNADNNILLQRKLFI